MSSETIEQRLIAITKQLLAESQLQYQHDIQLSSSLQQLGIDSLGRAELFQRIEKAFSVRLSDRLLAEAETLGDIVTYLQVTHPTLAPALPREVVASHGEKSSVDPAQGHTLTDILSLYSEHSATKAHIYFQNEEGKEEIITYRQLFDTALKVAASLHDLGLKKGETVAIMQPTTPDFFYSFFGTLLAGGIPVPIYPPFRAHMVEAYAKTESHILRNAEVRILITFERAEKLSLLLQGFVPSLNVVTTVPALLKSTALLAPIKSHAHDIAFIQYTSGSTNQPKGVVLTHQNLLSNIRAYGKAIGVTSEDVAVSWLPLYHDMGLIGMWLGSLYHGIPLVLLTPFSFLNHPERWLWAIHYHRGTLSGAPNFAYELCVRKIDPAVIEGLELSSWRMAANGAEKVYPRTLQQFATRFAPYGFKKEALLPVYGLAESTVALAIPKLGREFHVDRVDREQFESHRKAIVSQDKQALEFVACGVPIEGHDIRIVDDANQVLPEREIGHLQFRGPSSMQGYYNNPEATKSVMYDGWVDSGDLAYLAESEIYITGRVKDLIIKAGRNLYPAEIEEIVGAIPGVRQGCVTAFAVTNKERATEQLVVVAETREKDKSRRFAIVEAIKENMANALDILPDDIVLVAPHAVPKTSSGKLQRSACKKKYLEGQLGKKQAPAWMQVSKLSLYWLGQKIKNGLRWVMRLLYTTYIAMIGGIMLIPLWIISFFATRDVTAYWLREWARALLFLSFCPIEKKGLRHLRQVSPVIFAANHASYIDAIVLLAVLPITTRFIGKKELLNAPLIKTFIRKLDYLVVDRMDFSKGIEDAKNIEHVLKQGFPVLIFPEGTFGYGAGLRPFRFGAFKIATETHTPICPIALCGTRYILRDEDKLLSPGKMTLTVREPIYPMGNEWKEVTALRNAVRAEIAAFCGEPSLDFIAAKPVAAKLPKEETHS